MKKIIYIVMFLILSSCNNSQKIDEKGNYSVSIDSLNSVIDLPTGMKTFNNKLFVIDIFYEDSSILEYDSQTNNKYLLFTDSLYFSSYPGKYRFKQGNSKFDVLHRQAIHGKTDLSLDNKRMVKVIYNDSVLSFYEVEIDGIRKKWEHN